MRGRGHGGRAQLDTPYGRAAISWRATDDGLEVEVVVPPNSRGLLRLPDGTEHRVGSGRHRTAA